MFPTEQKSRQRSTTSIWDPVTGRSCRLNWCTRRQRNLVTKSYVGTGNQWRWVTWEADNMVTKIFHEVRQWNYLVITYEEAKNNKNIFQNCLSIITKIKGWYISIGRMLTDWYRALMRIKALSERLLPDFPTIAELTLYHFSNICRLLMALDSIFT